MGKYDDCLPSVEVVTPDEPPDYSEQPQAAKLWARERWILGELTGKEIANSIGVPYTTLTNWINRVWKK